MVGDQVRLLLWHLRGYLPPTDLRKAVRFRLGLAPSKLRFSRLLTWQRWELETVPSIDPASQIRKSVKLIFRFHQVY